MNAASLDAMPEVEETLRHFLRPTKSKKARMAFSTYTAASLDAMPEVEETLWRFLRPTKSKKARMAFST